ncbi:MAG TPA: proline iminopeptidase-family hydrolase [Allosphingosinicella sp.]|nr:proline iminopeptidase-family hydrolase [Allosphingosinicella sp.]
MSGPLDRRSVLGMVAGAALLPGCASPRRAPRPAAGLRPPDRELMVPVEGGRVYLRVNGDLAGPRPPILFVHGGPGSGHSNYLPALALADTRAVILYDQLDAGRSDAPGDPRHWRVARFVDEIDHIRRALALERLHVHGGSWGGTIALEYAARRPAGLASTILQSPLISTRRWLADAAILRRSLPPEVQATLDRCERPAPPPEPVCAAATEEFNRRFLMREPRPPAIAAYRAALPIPFNSRIYEAMWGKTEFVSTGTLKDYDGEPLLARLDGRRTLFMTGEHDEARPATVAAFARRVPGAEFVVIAGAGHAIAIDRPRLFLAVLDRWLKRHDGP